MSSPRNGGGSFRQSLGGKRLSKPQLHAVAPMGNSRTPPVYISTRRGREALERLHKQAPAEWRPIDRAYRTDWLRHRLREYVNVHGYASAGVCTLLEKAAAAYADGDYLRGLGASVGDHKLMLRAHQLADRGKQFELAAYEIAQREGKAKKQLDALERKGVERLAHVLQETKEERKLHGPHQNKQANKEPIVFGGITYEAPEPFPGADPEPQPEPKPPSPHQLLLDRLQQKLTPEEQAELTERYERPRNDSGQFVREGDEHDG